MHPHKKKDGVMRIPFVRGDPSVSAFLTLQDQDEFGAAKEQTGQVPWNKDLSEGIVAWRDGVSASSPKHWDRLINDFKVQLDQIEKDAKATRAVSFMHHTLHFKETHIPLYQQNNHD
jgi:hypothetical protein